ncbi:cytochrome c [Stappia sp. F7233]|uniref:Cytochrome c n=2 Tax=Stappia albiluteola TaxID=2758565 RepID=A0A839A7M2_9HYPH|nr:cytochrome c [Stappia albiluteola]
MPSRSSTPAAVSTSALVVPQLSTEAAEGKRVFDAVCAACHGRNALGTEQGPPLVHDIYNPGHHSDEAFYFAAANGVRQHHWPFGNMPPQKVNRAEVDEIIAYVRELQKANGITYRPHNM